MYKGIQNLDPFFRLLNFIQNTFGYDQLKDAYVMVEMSAIELMYDFLVGFW